MLDAHGTWLDQLQRSYIDLSKCRPFRLDRGARDQAPRQSLSDRFDRLRNVDRHQHALATQQLAKARAKQAPLRFGQVEMGAEIEQRHLANPAAFAPGFDQPVTVVDLARLPPASNDVTDVHASRIRQVKGFLSRQQNYYVTTKCFFRPPLATMRLPGQLRWENG